MDFFAGINPWMIVLLAIWTLPWKGFALWRAAQRNDWWWFVVMLVINTAAILEITYIFYFSERKKKPHLKHKDD